MSSVTQRKLAAIASALDPIPEVIKVQGLNGAVYLLIQVVVKDAGGLYRIAGRVFEIDGTDRITMGRVVRSLVNYRVAPPLARLSLD